MVGGGNRRDEGSFTVSSTNVFAALDSLKKKKKSDKEKGVSKGTSKAGESKEAQAKKQVYWAPAPLTSKSWADVDDEDDDDYYATTAPPQAWGGSSKPKETFKPDLVEESESEDDELFDEGDEVEEEHEHEVEARKETQPVLQKPVEASPVPKETERQLSKKERRKKELAELEAILADFGVNPKEKAGDEPSVVTEDQKEGQANGDVDKKNMNLAPVESKSAKKKKKKEKASKEAAKEAQDQPNSSGAPNGPEDNAGSDEEASSAIDVKEKLKKLASAKKKKSSKEMDGSARAAAVEAAARNAKLAAAKKKEKSHYNQQPMR